MHLVSWATALSALSALLTCLVVALPFAARLTLTHFGTAISLLFIDPMLTIGAGFAAFPFESRLAVRAVRVRSELLQHEAERD